MTLKIYLYKNEDAIKKPRFPEFVLNFETDENAIACFNQLFKDISFSNNNYIKIGTAIFKKSLFYSATLQ